MFFHTKQKTTKSSKRQTKNKLPKLMTIESQVKDFFPFKIRPDSSKTTASKTAKSEYARSTINTSMVSMTTNTQLSEKVASTPRAPSSVQKVRIKSNPRIIISEDRAVSGNVNCHKTSRHYYRRKTPETEAQRKSPERQMLYRHYAPYYEEYCNRNLPRSLTNVRYVDAGVRK